MNLSKKAISDISYSIGNATIDNDHLFLFQVYSKLIAMTEKEKWDRKTLAGILSKLTDFSLYHFKKEENYMRKMNYPKYEVHKILHKEYIYQVALFNTELLGSNPPSSKEIIEFVKNWLDNHIFKEDIKYEKYKKEKGLDINY